MLCQYVRTNTREKLPTIKVEGERSIGDACHMVSSSKPWGIALVEWEIFGRVRCQPNALVLVCDERIKVWPKIKSSLLNRISEYCKGPCTNHRP